MLVVQLILYCMLFTAMVRYSVKGGAIKGLYFYPKAVQDRAYEIGLTDRETVEKDRKRVMRLFYACAYVFRSSGFGYMLFAACGVHVLRS